jgi:hypothetical protein
MPDARTGHRTPTPTPDTGHRTPDARTPDTYRTPVTGRADAGHVDADGDADRATKARWHPDILAPRRRWNGGPCAMGAHAALGNHDGSAVRPPASARHCRLHCQAAAGSLRRRPSGASAHCSPRRFRVERRANGEASSVLASACHGTVLRWSAALADELVRRGGAWAGRPARYSKSWNGRCRPDSTDRVRPDVRQPTGPMAAREAAMTTMVVEVRGRDLPGRRCGPGPGR